MMTDHNQTEMDDMLATAASLKPSVPSDLVARVLNDAQQVQPPAYDLKKQGVGQKQGIWDAILDMIGGWPAVGGLAMAGVTGLWIGVAPPTGLDTMATRVLGSTQTVDLFGGDMVGILNEGLDG